MKNYIYIIAILWLIVPSMCIASELEPKQCSIGNRPLDQPLDCVELLFEGEIELKENAKAFVTNGEVELISSSSFEISKYTTSLGKESLLTIFFNRDCLPKGDTYTFHLAKESVCLSDTPAILNNEYSVSFSVPNDLGEATFSLYRDGDIIKSEKIISCSWMYEIIGCNNTQWLLYRDDELIRTYQVDISNDWDLGTAYLDFNEYLNFEDGVNFKLILPEGSIHAKRPDIVNKEVMLEFIGGYKEPMDYPSYYWCSLYEDIPSVIYEVNFYFNIPIQLIPGKPIIFSGVKGNENKSWNTFPVLSNDGENWILTADFGGIELKEGWIYTIEIPEGTVVTDGGDIVVNNRQSVSVENSGMTDINLFDPNISIIGTLIQLSNIKPNSHIIVYDSKGRIIKNTMIPHENSYIEIEYKGLYIISINNKIFKLII